MKSERIYLPGLNGLRAIAALTVVISHTDLLPNVTDFGLKPIFNFSIPMAAFAVTLFFVISGFLITYLLIHEMDIKKDIDVKKFYMRRILRIWPIYYLFLVVAVSLYCFMNQGDIVHPSSLFLYVFFGANIPFILEKGVIFIVNHYWSIGVEEQFYLFWPWIVRVIKKRLIPVSLIIFISLFVLKLFFWKIYGNHSFGYRLLFVNRFDCMMIGAVGAILYYQKNIRFIKLFSNKIVQSFSWLLLMTVSFRLVVIPLPIAHEIVSIGCLSIIIGQITVKQRMINLENKQMDFIGKISYGIYVIHPLVLMLLSRLYEPLKMNLLIKYPLVFFSTITFTIIVAWISYTYFEKPFLKMKNKFTIVKSSNSMFLK